MIAALKGVIAEKSLQRVVVDVGGVGYLINVSMQTLADLPAAGEPVQLRCHTHVREDALQIFGFTQALEQQAFELLILVSGIGPKLALTALSGMPVERLLTAIARGDHAALQRIPGVGKKTAERVVVELRERCAKLKLPEQPGLAAPSPPAGLNAEVVEALINLGYKRKLAEQAVARASRAGDGDELGPEQLLRASLSAMAEQT